MLVLLDNGAPRGTARALLGHTVTNAENEVGRPGQWRTACGSRGAGFEVLISTDKNIRYQQNLAGRQIAIVVLGKDGGGSSPLLAEVAAAVNAASGQL